MAGPASESRARAGGYLKSEINYPAAVAPAMRLKLGNSGAETRGDGFARRRAGARFLSEK